MPKFIDLSGWRFGRLTVQHRAPDHVTSGGNHLRMWQCACDCGIVKTISAGHLSCGDTMSCGCMHREIAALSHTLFKPTHNGSYTAEYGVWRGMLKRCANHNDKNFSNYGGRGIKVCERWQRFEVFLADMGRRPSNRHSIERKNNDGNYDPANCRWATMREQNQNRRSNVFIEHKGERKCMAEWARILGVHAATIRNRINAGLSPDGAATV